MMSSVHTQNFLRTSNSSIVTIYNRMKTIIDDQSIDLKLVDMQRLAAKFNAHQIFLLYINGILISIIVLAQLECN